MPSKSTVWIGGAALALAYLAVVALVLVPGPLSIDEVVYFLTARSVPEGYGVEVANGYSELPSPELELLLLRGQDGGKLVPQYPYLFPLVAWPAYAVAGFAGLIWVNALAFVGAMVFTWRIAEHSFPGRRIAIPACAILAGATFAWEYALGAWPHMAALCLILAAYDQCLRSESKTARHAFVAGLLIGLAVSVRLDAVLALAALAMGLLLARPVRFREAWALTAGVAPVLLVLTWTNWIKFGIFSPLTYGGTSGATSLSSYPPLIAVGVGALLVLWAVTRERSRIMLAAHPMWAGGLAVAALTVALAVPASRHALARLLDGTLQLLVDLRLRDRSIEEPALTRSASGALIYAGGLKKSLLQSCPYLAVLLLPLARAVGHGQDSRALRWLFLPFIPFLAVYGFFAWHGGLCLNLRYFLPLLPFGAILTAYVWRELVGLPAPRRLLLATGAVTAALFGALNWLLQGAEAKEFLYLSVPLYLALVVSLLAVAWHMGRGRGWNGVPKALAVALVAALVWGGLVAFIYDLAWARQLRIYNAEVARTIGAAISTPAILFVTYPDPFALAAEGRDLFLAVPARDGFADFRKLVEFHTARGRRAYAVFPLSWWRDARRDELLEGLKIVTRWQAPPWGLAELAVEAAGAGGTQQDASQPAY